MSDSRYNQGRPPPGIRGPGPMGGGGPGQFAAMGAKARDFKGTIRQLAAYLKPYGFTIVFVWAMALLSTIFAIVGPKVMGAVTDELVAGITRQVSGTGIVDFVRIAQILLWLLGLYVISTLCSLLQGFLMTGVSMKVSYTLRDSIDQKIHRLPFTSLL